MSSLFASEQRRKVVQEIIDTEQQFYDNLTTLVEVLN
jgi:hypothetical protein